MATPIFDEEAAKRLKAAKGLAIQGSALPPVSPAIGAVPALNAPQKAQQAAQITSAVGQQAAQQTTQMGQANLAATQLQLQQQEAQNKQRLAEREIGQKAFLGDNELLQGLSLSEEKRQAEERLTHEEIASAKRTSRLGLETDANLSFLTRTQREQLGALGADVKEKIFDSRLQFSKDEAGRKFSNERQLRDYAIINAKSEQELENKLMTQKLLHQRGIQMLEVAQNKVNEALRQASADRGRELSQSTQEYIANVQGAAERAMARKKARGSAMASIISGAFTIGGALIGGLPTMGAGGAAGAAAGAAIGSKVGDVVVSQKGE
jgi:hypothetical protein